MLSSDSEEKVSLFGVGEIEKFLCLEWASATSCHCENCNCNDGGRSTSTSTAHFEASPLLSQPQQHNSYCSLERSQSMPVGSPSHWPNNESLRSIRRTSFPMVVRNNDAKTLTWTEFLLVQGRFEFPEFFLYLGVWR